jgi:class 3 adenylate cyclase
MEPKEKIPYSLHAIEILYSLIVLAWFIIPLFINVGIFPVTQLPDLIFPAAGSGSLAHILALAVLCLMPLISVFKIAALFLYRMVPVLASPVRSIPNILNFANSGLVIASIITHVMIVAKSASYFRSSSPILYAVLLLSVVFNAYFVYIFISRQATKDAAYKEYLEFKRSSSDRPQGILQALVRQGIQKRLILIFVPMVLLIIALLSFVLMQNFSRTILSTMIQNGKDLADRTASTIKVDPSDTIAADDYLSTEATKNNSASLPFQVISYFQKDPGADTFTIRASTDRSLVGTKSGPIEEFSEAMGPLFPIPNIYEFRAPITLGVKKTFLGYVTVQYARDVIFESYFRTQVMVFCIAALFIYTSIFLILVSGRAIVYPILFLRMSVNALSNVLSGMIKGKVKVSSELLQYKDRVQTKDEIKSLSNEIGNMATVIRGIVPYISASTLKHSEREGPMTEARDLTFLFTDIRGFTTMSEGMKPDKLVELLNHYLDIQSTIIYNNHGDVDKFVGDEVMAMFEGAHKELNACKASMEIRKAMAEEKELALAAKKHAVSIGIGINTGPVSFGSVGAKERMDFTSIGDTVNLAARLEGANKTYGTKTLLTDAIYQKVKGAFLCREIDLMTVKGKTKPVRIYELLQLQKAGSEKLTSMKKIFEEGLQYYRAQKWPAAEKAFVFLKEKFKDEASEMFLKRIAFFKRNPPEKDWDGVFNLTVK